MNTSQDVEAGEDSAEPASDRDEGGKLPAKISDIHLSFSVRRPIIDDGSRGIERWTVSAVANGPESRDGQATHQPVGELQILIVDLLKCPDPWEALDSSNDNIAHIGETVFDVNSGQLTERLDARLDRVGDRVLVLDRVELQPQWQRHNLAALLAGESLDQLRTGCRVALCFPGPLERFDATDEEHENAAQRMTGVWSQLGFSPFDEGVWLLDPNRRTLDDSRAALRTRHGLTPHV